MADSLPAGLRAVLFDFDGTLADSYAAIAASVNHVRAHHQLPPLSVAAVQRHVGRGPDHLIEQTVGGDEVAADVLRYRTHHPSVMKPLTHLLAGAADVLKLIRQTGRRAAVCSNKPRIFTSQLLASLEIASWIDVVVGPEDVPHPKPAPDMLLLGLSRLGVTKEEALYIGDMTVDIQTARAAGVRVWVVPTGSDARETLEAARPNRLLRDLMELKEMFERRGGEGNP